MNWCFCFNNVGITNLQVELFFKTNVPVCASMCLCVCMCACVHACLHMCLFVHCVYVF